jgi:hypothetical protein
MRRLAALVMTLVAALPAAAGPFCGPADGIPGTSAVFVAWAESVREFIPAPNGSGGFCQDDAGNPCAPTVAVAGRPAVFGINDATRHVLSLGTGGQVTLALPGPVCDGPGPDFAVFENGFADLTGWEGTSREGSTQTFTFAEFARVEVGTTTSAWARFPPTYLGTDVLYNFDNLDDGWFASQDVTLADGLAGKHTIDGGTPFDLSALAGDPAVTSGAVDLANIHFIRLQDVPGDGTMTDRDGRPIRDPYYHFQAGYPTPALPSITDGFDLRAVGLIHVGGVAIGRDGAAPRLAWFGLDGRTYELQASTNLATWTDAGPPVTGTNGPAAAAAPPAASGFFRLVRTGP